jgi:7,8-dihydropterin-6-yl-methyl-4-(beta-D-ribofuranosyl)aminobenzene 5'-phosphate synthase
MKAGALLVSFLLFSISGISQKNSITIKEGSITNLYDAFGKNTALLQDFGFSCITKYQGKTILFDAGSNADFFKYNVERLGETIFYK